MAASRVEVNAQGVTGRCPGGKSERVAWADLTRVWILTTDEGPFVEDSFWVLEGGNGEGCVVGNEEMPGELLDRLMALPGFNHDTMIKAMGTADDGRFECWKAPSGVE